MPSTQRIPSNETHNCDPLSASDAGGSGEPHSTRDAGSSGGLGGPEAAGDLDPPTTGDRGASIAVRRTRPEDFTGIERLALRVYPDDGWPVEYLRAQHRAFPEGQLVALDRATGEVVGMAASLIIDWRDYDPRERYWTITGGGRFRNHDPGGDTLYGAEVMTDPRRRRQGIGKKLYAARRRLAGKIGVGHIRAGARLPGYGKHGRDMSCEEYVERVVRGELADPTLSFQLGQGFRVIEVVDNYARFDRQSRGYAALIECDVREKPQRVAA